jgi:large subunit ribosomal protein L35
MKTNRGLRKRVKKTATGKILRGGACKRHLNSHKSAKRKRHLRRKAVVPKGDAKRLKRMLG